MTVTLRRTAGGTVFEPARSGAVSPFSPRMLCSKRHKVLTQRFFHSLDARRQSTSRQNLANSARSHVFPKAIRARAPIAALSAVP